MMKTNLVIDFDSTIVRVEALDELAKIVLAKAPDRESRVRKIEAITRAGMEGKIAFSESLRRRLQLFTPSRDELGKLTDLLLRNITSSLEREKSYIRENSDSIYVISGGFREYIIPVVKSIGFRSDHVLANTFVSDSRGEITGFDSHNPLSWGAKQQCLEELELDRPVIMVGDGFSDYLVRKTGAADAFIAFTENVTRGSAALRADRIARSFEDVIDELTLWNASATTKELVEVGDQI